MQKRILVVDDDELSRDLLSEMFEVEYDIVEAKNGADALNVLSISLGVVECVLLDLMMPTLDGFDFLKEFNDRGWNERVPVIVVSSSDDEETKQRCRDLGVNYFIVKPYRHGQVMDILEKAMNEFAERNTITADSLPRP